MSVTVARRVKSTRLQKKWSAEELAEKTGLKPSAISHIECARRSPNIENLVKLADALDVSTDYLLGRKAQP